MQHLRDPFATPARQVKLAGHPIMVSDDKPTFWSRVSAGAWEPGALGAISAHVGPQSVFLDLGAWVGPTTLLAARLGARCIAVEADPQALTELRCNLAVNPDLAPRVTVIGRAVSAAAGPVTLAARRKPGDSMSSVLLAGQTDARRTTWDADAVTPAELAALTGADVPLFIKLDIEGGEFALLPHLAPLLRRGGDDRPAPTAALVSFHPGILRETGVSMEEITALTARALAPFDGWASLEIDPPLSGGAVKYLPADDASPDAGAIAHGAQSDTWLFIRPTP